MDPMPARNIITSWESEQLLGSKARTWYYRQNGIPDNQNSFLPTRAGHYSPIPDTAKPWFCGTHLYLAPECSKANRNQDKMVGYKNLTASIFCNLPVLLWVVSHPEGTSPWSSSFPRAVVILACGHSFLDSLPLYSPFVPVFREGDERI